MRPAERGLTLVELLVAMTVLLIVMACALSVYDATWASFKKSEEAAEQQQGTRIAFDRVGSDLQVAGLDFNPDGNPDRPDEQIEAAYDTAVVLRADFDRQLEPALAGGAFATVSTGNDEVVAYVLAKPGETGGDKLRFKADMKEQLRDGSVETIEIDHVALRQDDPPYTLYRITFNDYGSWGSSSFETWQMLAENIGSMTFRYYDAAGTQLNPCDVDDLGDDIGGEDGAADKAMRGRIHRVELQLVGFARDPNLDWIDPSDSNPATRHYHKFTLASSINLRNHRMAGIPDAALDGSFDIDNDGDGD